MHRRVITGLLALSLGLLATGLYVLSFFEGPPTPTLHALAPRDADVYVSLFLRPSTAQRSALRDLFGDEATATSKIEQLFDSVLRRFDMRYDEDVEPWAGEEVAAFALGSDYAFLFGTDDLDAAMTSASEMLSRGSEGPIVDATYEGTSFSFVKSFAASGLPLASGSIGDALVIGTPGGLRQAIDAAAGESPTSGLPADTEAEDLTADRIAAVYVKDADSLVERLPSSLSFAFGALGIQGDGYQAVVFAESEALVVESTGREPLRLTPQMLSGFLSFEI